MPEIVGTGRVGRYDRSSRDSDRDPALDAVPALPACVAFDGTRYQAAGVSQLRDDALGRGAVEEDRDADAPHAAGGDGVAGVRAVRVPVVRADGGVAGAVREPGVLVAVLAPGARARGRGGMSAPDPQRTARQLIYSLVVTAWATGILLGLVLGRLAR